ncbi:xanthine dehydrogenase family protein molybdopterin-binding subunit [Lapillicoccus jejuensis]|uniref:Carbon-monoxide dehydrogenase large subunit n=1 Tax=Lapillicoccus jejuensis TaxID=402171 RepID=A0A542DVG4_9MICO|nr:xanthine dehydrogenase family protein molybdopterin-binding subunit [Lapillicoccus jejuensis]TQJ07077.1 carbon-monoxide dehydrogenase large subunit [Lapillicoccus jejuensis]
MAGSLLGNAVRRVEDPDLVTGRSTYVDDIRTVDGVLHAVFVRSYLAHARITGIDVEEARRAPGVHAVLTGADLDLGPVIPFATANGDLQRQPLATDRVRFVGEPVAVVVAETRAQAVDAAELVDVDYEELPVVVDVEAAVADEAPLQFDEAPRNIAGGDRSPDQDDVLAGAAHVVRLRMVNNRLAVAPMEGNAVLAVPGSPEDEYDLTVHVATQMPHLARTLVRKTFGLESARVRVIAPHVGGAFGGKAAVGPEHYVAIAAARHLGRPVKWVETRSEAMLSMQGRGQVDYLELGLDEEGHFLGLRCRVLGDCGAYAGFGGSFAYSTTYIMAPGVYRVGKLDYAGVAVLTNTTPVGAFRGAGRPEAAEMLERLVDLAADETGIDPAELRRRNFIEPDAFPFTTLAGMTYDNGDYDAPLTKALQLAGYDDLRVEQAARRERGDVRQLGIGLSVYAEITGGGSSEIGMVEVADDGTVTVRAGTSSHGQGHATAFSMIVADKLGVPLEQVRFEQSDTALVPRGGGTGGSRSLQIGGSAVAGAADDVVALAREVAARMLEASVDDVRLEEGRFHVAGVPTPSIGWGEVAARSREDGEPLRADHDFTPENATFPFGAHVSVVEVDTETGLVTPTRHVAVDDCGRILNPLLVEGQQHGGIAQGMSQALWEEFCYDDAGQPVTATFADYGIPAATEVPSFETANTETPTHLNPLGAKGIGESATVGSTPAVHNAVVDALSHLGVRHVDMPLTPQRVVEAVRRAGDGTLPDLWREPPAVFDDLEVRGGSEEVTNI